MRKIYQNVAHRDWSGDTSNITVNYPATKNAWFSFRGLKVEFSVESLSSDLSALLDNDYAINAVVDGVPVEFYGDDSDFQFIEATDLVHALDASVSRLVSFIANRY